MANISQKEADEFRRAVQELIRRIEEDPTVGHELLDRAGIRYTARKDGEAIDITRSYDAKLFCSHAGMSAQIRLSDDQ
tara:strand:- start:4570 stop:4803 length:234 start_codon:yes stop_codon:yes gene_type:complete